MQPDDLSMPRGDSKIREKLNLHVKKRLQETGKSSKCSPEPASCPAVVSSCGGPSGSKTKKIKTKHSPSTSSSSISIIPSSSSSHSAIAPPLFASGSCSSSNKPATELLLSPGGIGGNSNDSSFNSVDLDPDANASNDGQDRGNGEKNIGGNKTCPKPDIFTLILNEKKSSLMRDPEVIKFLKDVMDKGNKN